MAPNSNITKEVILYHTLPDASGVILTTGNLHCIEGKNATFMRIMNNLHVYDNVVLGNEQDHITFLGETYINGDIRFGRNKHDW